MKFGILINKNAKNIGDDIQSYAAAKLLPRVDYAVDREHIDTFSSKNNEPVAVLMNGWWMWRKWNWPPADCIIPKLTSMHINTYSVEQQGTPIYNEWLTGCGKEYMKRYGPVGCRDHSTLALLKEAGIDGYFSGCLTLTLPRQPKTLDAGTYVCLVDLNHSLEAKAKELLKNTGLEIRVLSHDYKDRPPGQTLQQRFKKTEEFLSQYQNAKFVITRRLHVTLPCIALNTPVLSVVNKKNVKNTTRWDSYSSMLNYIDNSDFLAGNFDFDFQNPPANRDAYLPIRDALIRETEEFIKQYEDCGKPLDQVKKISYTPEEKLLWQHKLMKQTLNKWFKDSRSLVDQKERLQKNLNSTAKDLKKYQKFVQQLQKDGIITEVNLPEIAEPPVLEYELPNEDPSLMERALKKALRAFRK